MGACYYGKYLRFSSQATCLGCRIMLKEIASFLQSMRCRHETVNKKLSELRGKLVEKIEGGSELPDPSLLGMIGELYALRWSLIRDTIDDYMRSPYQETGVISSNATNVAAQLNDHWVMLAQRLASEKCVASWHQLLMPTLRQDVSSEMKRSPLNHCILSDNNDYLISLRVSLDSHEKRKPIHQSFLNCSQRQLEWFTPRETYRIRYASSEYSGYWRHSIVRKPYPFLVAYYQLVQSYYQGLDSPDGLVQFKKAIDDFVATIKEDTGIDLREFWDVAHGWELWPDKLVSWSKATNLMALSNELTNWACMLAKRNPAWIIKHPLLSQTYSQLGFGAGITLINLQKWLFLLTPTHPKTVMLLDALKTLVAARIQKERLVIDEEVLKQLAIIYATHWSFIENTKDDYTRDSSHTDAVGFVGLLDWPNTRNSWLVLAQILSGAGLITEHYFSFLIPSLTNHIEPISQRPFEDFYLCDCALTDDGRSLIVLPALGESHKQTGRMVIYCDRGARPPTPTEVERIGQVSEKYADLCATARQEIAKPDPSISRKTIDALYKLVNGCFYPHGIYAGREYDPKQLRVAEEAFLVFQQFCETLPRSERDALEAQRLCVDGRHKTVFEVFRDIERHACIALCGKFILQLVLDYSPWRKFRQDIEAMDSMAQMRLSSKRKIYKEHAGLSLAEVRSRLEQCLVYLLVHPFRTMPLTGHWISWGAFLNKVTRTAQCMYQEITRVSDDTRQLHSLYCCLMDWAIAANNDQRPMVQWSRYPDTKDWLSSLVNQSFFTTQPPSVSVPVLFLALCRLNRDTLAWKGLLHSYLETLTSLMVTLYTASQTRREVILTARIEFAKFFTSLLPRQQQQIRAVLSEVQSLPLEQKNQLIKTQLLECLARKMMTPAPAVATNNTRIMAVSHVVSEETIRGIIPSITESMTVRDCIESLRINLGRNLTVQAMIQRNWQRVFARSLSTPMGLLPEADGVLETGGTLLGAP